jgi:hypothetical protein
MRSNLKPAQLNTKHILYYHVCTGPCLVLLAMIARGGGLSTTLCQHSRSALVCLHACTLPHDLAAETISRAGWGGHTLQGWGPAAAAAAAFGASEIGRTCFLLNPRDAVLVFAPHECDAHASVAGTSCAPAAVDVRLWVLGRLHLLNQHVDATAQHSTTITSYACGRIT